MAREFEENPDVEILETGSTDTPLKNAPEEIGDVFGHSRTANTELANNAEQVREKLDKLRELADTCKIKKVESPEDVSNLLESISLEDIQELSSNEFQEHLKIMKNKYGLETEEFSIREIQGLKNYLKSSPERFAYIVSEEFAEQLDGLAGQIGGSKAEIAKYLIAKRFSPLDNPAFKSVWESKIVFSEDVGKSGLTPEEIFEKLPGRVMASPTLWGRERKTGVMNMADYAIYGQENPYQGWAYAASGLGATDENLKGKITPEFLNGEMEGEPGIAQARLRLEYVQKHLPEPVKERLAGIFSALGEWGEAGRKLEQKEDGSVLPIRAGAYARYDDKLDLKLPLDKKMDLPASRYAEVYGNLDAGFKSVSWITLRIGKGIDELYRFATEEKDKFKQECRNLEYLAAHKNELSPAEAEILEKKSRHILNPLEIMESIYRAPRGVYLTNPPLHSGHRGEEAKKWSPESYMLRDHVFYKTKHAGAENYANVKEYHLNENGDDLKIRLYSFSGRPNERNFGENGMSVEIERNGEIKILKAEEIEKLSEELKRYTLPTLYLEKAPLLMVDTKGE